MRCFLSFIFLPAVIVGLTAGTIHAEMISSNVAALKTASSSGGNAARGCDDSYQYVMSDGNDGAWWEVDLGQAYDVSHLELSARYADRINGAILRVYDADRIEMTSGSGLTLSGFDTNWLQSIDNGGAGWSGVHYFRIADEDDSLSQLYIRDLMAYADVELYDTFIAGVTATASGTQSHIELDAQNLVNNRGMTDQSGPLGNPDALHQTLLHGNWTFNPGESSPWLIFDLGGPHVLDRMLIWNAMQGTGGTAPGGETWWARGFKDVTVETSMDGDTWTPVDDQNGETEGDYTVGYYIAGAPAVRPYSGDVDMTVEGEDATAAYVRLTGITNYGDAVWGLSEVRLYAVPEPSTLLLLTGGLLLLLGRRRSG